MNQTRDPSNDATEAIEQARLVESLRDPACYPHEVAAVEHLETHISHVLLAGEFAYKLKKPLDLGFLDFSSLEKRRFYCEEELRLNRRLAPQLYLEVAPIRGSHAAPRLGLATGAIIDYAVRMRRFPQEALFDRLAREGALRAGHIDALAQRIATFHAGIARSNDDTPWGRAASIEAPMRQNFAQLRPLLSEPAELQALESIEQWSFRAHARLANLFEARRRAGQVRECHGDLHLGNVAWLNDTAQPFDGIEFNANLRWIDVISEVAFMVMDLHAHDLAPLAWRFLNGWLEHSGDFAGVAVLDYYLVYRAMVRAKIARLRATQPDIDTATQRQALADHARYMSLASRFCAPRRPALILMHGLSGSGKSVLATAIGERLAAVHLKSDVERKRLHGLTPLARTGSAPGGGIYSAEASRATYAELARLARLLLEAGWPVVVDATCLRRAQRAVLRAVATACATPLLVVACDAEPAVLRQRIVQRQIRGQDASEADLAVLEQQFAGLEPLDETPMANETRLVIDTARQSIDDAVSQVAAALAGG